MSAGEHTITVIFTPSIAEKDQTLPLSPSSTPSTPSKSQVHSQAYSPTPALALAPTQAAATTTTAATTVAPIMLTKTLVVYRAKTAVLWTQPPSLFVHQPLSSSFFAAMLVGVEEDEMNHDASFLTKYGANSGSPIEQRLPPRGLKNSYLRYINHHLTQDSNQSINQSINQQGVVSSGSSKNMLSHNLETPWLPPPLAISEGSEMCTEGYVFPSPGVYTMDVVFDASLLSPIRYGRCRCRFRCSTFTSSSPTPMLSPSNWLLFFLTISFSFWPLVSQVTINTVSSPPTTTSPPTSPSKFW